jgi:hypothetical protein
MMDWGMALSVGLAVALISEVSILGAMILPKIPIEPGKTWRGTVSAVSVVSVLIGGVGGYIAGQFGGRGGGGAVASGPVPVTTTPVVANPMPTNNTKVEATRPVRPETYLAAQVDIFFKLDGETRLIANHTCEVVAYRKQGSQWMPEFSKVVGKNLEDFLRIQDQVLATIQKDIPEADAANKRLRVFLDPFPGEGVYDKIRQQAEAKGWKVDRKNVAWQPENPKD